MSGALTTHLAPRARPGPVCRRCGAFVHSDEGVLDELCDPCTDRNLRDRRAPWPWTRAALAHLLVILSPAIASTLLAMLVTLDAARLLRTLTYSGAAFSLLATDLASSNRLQDLHLAALITLLELTRLLLGAWALRHSSPASRPLVLALTLTYATAQALLGLTLSLSL